MAVNPSVARRALTYCLVCLLAWQPLLANAGGITPTQTSNDRPTLDQAPNGVPVINIQNPNAKGVSQNFYRDFNVDKRGLVLNNDRTLHQTQLGGYIEGNPNLKSGTASLILNEVIGANPSALNGYIEVGGAKADVVVANPNGISCSGCGFINTNHATLTTGKPLLDASGALQGYDVQTGQVTIGGDGLNASNLDRFDIIARGVKLSAQLHANELNLVTGKQQVTSDTLTTSHASTDGKAPTYAIDSSELGGIYANRIRLIANEQGVGVKLDAPVAAQDGDLVLTADGNIRFANASATHDLHITSSGEVVAAGTAVATNAMHINAAAFTASGQQVSARTLDINAAHTSVGAGASLYGIDQLGVEGDSLDNAGDIASDHNITIGADAALASLNNTGSVFAGNNLGIHADNLTNASGAELSAGNDIHITSDNLTNQGKLLAQQSLELTTRTLSNTRLPDAVDGDGVIGGLSGSATITADTISNLIGAQLYGGEQLRLDATSLDNSGSISAGSDLVIGQSAALASLHNAGSMAASNELTLSADTLTNASGAVMQANDINATLAGDLTNQGKLLALHNLVLKAQHLTNEQLADAPADSGDGVMGGLGSASITADTITNLVNAVLYGGDFLQLDSNTLDNAGNISAQQDIVIGANAVLASLHNSGGVSAGRDLSLHADDLTNASNALLRANRNISLTASRIANEGNITNWLPVTADGDEEASDTGGVITLVADTISNLLGAQIYSTSGLSLDAASLDNSGSLVAQQNLTASVTTTFTNASGADVQAGNNIDISADAITNQGRLLSWNWLTLTASQITNEKLETPKETDGMIGGQGGVQINADNLDNLNYALLGSNGNMQLLVRQVLNNVLSEIYAQGDIYIAANLPAVTEGMTPEELEAAYAAVTKTASVINKNGDITTGAGNIWIYANKLDNSRHVATEEDHHISAYDLMEANWLALHDSDEHNDFIGLLDGGKTLSKDDWLFVFDAKTNRIPLYVTDGEDGRRNDAYVDYWLSKYVGYLNSEYGAGLSATDIKKIRAKVDGLLPLQGEFPSYTDFVVTERVKGNKPWEEATVISRFDTEAFNAWANDYMSDLNEQLGGIFSPADVATEVDSLYNLFSEQYRFGSISLLRDDRELQLKEYYLKRGTLLLASRESAPLKVDNKRNPLADSMWIVARVSQYIKALRPDIYADLETQITQALKDDYAAVNVRQSGCQDWTEPDDCDNGAVRFFQFKDDRYDDVLTADSETRQSLISSGSGLYINADTIDNQFSTIASAGDMVLNGGDIINDGVTLRRHYELIWGSKSWHNDDDGVWSTWFPGEKNYTGSHKYDVDLVDENGDPLVVKSLIVAGGNLSGTLEGNLRNRDATYLVEHHMPGFDDGSFKMPEEPADQPDPDASEQEGEPEPPTYTDWGGADVTRVIDTINARTLELLDRHNGLFSVNRDPNYPYLIETNPLFATQDGFLGSEYLIDRLGLTPNTTQRRLGDSYYETTLIRDAVIAATGMRFLDPFFHSDQDQFTWLMNNAIAAAESMQLAVGVSLSAEQINALQQDIVWMEEKEVAGVKVLVPVLYLAPGSANLADQGAVISANHGMALNVNGLANSGAMAAGEDMNITAGEHGVINLEGLMQSGGTLGVNSKGDIQNLSSTMRGRDVSLHSDHNILNSARVNQTEEQWANGTYLRTEHGDGSLIEGKDKVVLDAANIGIIGSNVKGGTVVMNAANNLIVGSIGVQNKFDGHAGSAEYTNDSTYQLASSIDATLDLIGVAGNNIEVTGSTMSAGNHLGLTALNGDITIKSAANSSYEHYHYEDSDEDTTRTDATTTQLQSMLSAGGTMDINAVLGNLMVTASGMSSGGDMSLNAGQTLQFLAAQNQDYHFAQTDKDGDYGAKSHKKDETNKVTNVVVSLNSGGKLTLTSGGDQTYQAARLNGDAGVHLVTPGHVSFEAVKNLVSESHESSSGDLAWNKMAGNGQVNETLLQTQITTQANLAIDAAQGISIDVNDINAKTISDTIDAMVAKDPKLAWLKDAEDRGDVDWQKIKETHDSWDYESQSMGAATALVVAIVATVATGGAALAAGGAVAGAATAAGATASAMAGAAAAAVVSSAAVQTASAVVNNQGNLGGALDDLDHSGTYKGLAVAGVTAGLMKGVSIGFSNMGFGSVSNDPITNLTHGFDLNTPSGMAGFAAYKGVEAGVSAGVSSSVFGTSFNDAFKTNIEQAGNDTLAAFAFNAVGGLATDQMAGSKTHVGFNAWSEGGINKVALHSLVGGGLSYISDHDFATGAAAGALNEALSPTLTNLLGESGAGRTAGSQIAGMAGALATDGDVNTGANIGKLADGYNRQLHKEEMNALLNAAEGYSDLQQIGRNEAIDELLLQANRTVDAGYNASIENNPVAESYLNVVNDQYASTHDGKQLFQTTPLSYVDATDSADHLYEIESIPSLGGGQPNRIRTAMLNGVTSGQASSDAAKETMNVMDWEGDNKSAELGSQAGMVLGGALAAPVLISGSAGLYSWTGNALRTAGYYGNAASRGATTWNEFQSSLAGLGFSSGERAALWQGYKAVGGVAAGNVGRAVILETGTQLATEGGALTWYSIFSGGAGVGYGMMDHDTPEAPEEHPLALPFTAGVAVGHAIRVVYDWGQK